MSKFQDLTGQKFNRLTVIAKAKKGWICRCECGKEIIVQAYALTHGRHKSCGCYKKDIMSKSKGRS